MALFYEKQKKGIAFWRKTQTNVFLLQGLRFFMILECQPGMEEVAVSPGALLKG